MIYGMEDLLSLVIMAMYFVIPIGAIVMFVVCLFHFLYLRMRSREAGDVSPEKLRGSKIRMIVTSVIAGVMAEYLIGLLFLVAFFFELASM